MLKCSLNFRLPVRSKEIHSTVLACCLVQVIIFFQCSFGVASAGEQQVRQKVHNEALMLGEVLDDGDFAASSFGDGIYSFLNGAIEIIDTADSFYQNDGSGDKDSSNSDDDGESHLILLISIGLSVWTAIYLLYYDDDDLNDHDEP